MQIIYWRGECQKRLMWVGMIGLGFYAGCAAPRNTDELIRLAGDSNLADRRRLAVVEEVLSRPLNRSQQDILGQQLAQVMNSPRHSPVIRRRALALISQRYQDEAALWLGQALLNTNEPEICRDIVAALVKLKDKRAVPYLVVAGYEKGKIRPGPAGLVQKTLEQIAQENIITVLAGQIAANSMFPARLAALAGLKQHVGLEQTIALVLKLENNDDFINLLQFWARHFQYIPTNSAGFFVCQTQQMSLTDGLREQLQQRAGFLAQKWQYRFIPQDSYVILKAPKTDLEQTPQIWTNKITQRLASLTHTKRPPSYPGAPDDYQEDFIGRCRLFSYTDLIRMTLLLKSLAQSETIERLQQLLQDDLADVETEAGGLCFLDDMGQVLFKPYPPGRRIGDNHYVESPEMTRQAPLCLARWHCHADPGRQKGLAGPGTDDLQYAAYHNCPLVVVTYVSENVVNVDYCNPEGLVVDLGNY